MRARDFCISRLIYLLLRRACAVMPLRMHTCLCACIVLNLNFMAPPINNYHICANACLKSGKSLMSAQQPFVVFFVVLRVDVFERCTWRVWIMRENPVRCKCACARASLRMPISKRRRISRKIQKPIALA